MCRNVLCSYRALYRIGDSVRLFVDLIELATFNEQTNFWLGTRIPEEHAAFAGELFLSFAYEFHHRVQLGQRPLFFHYQISLSLRVFFQTRLQFT